MDKMDYDPTEGTGMYCAHCGCELILEGVRYMCPYCGRVLKEHVEPDKQKRTATFVLIAIAVMAILAIAALLFMTYGHDLRPQFLR